MNNTEKELQKNIFNKAFDEILNKEIMIGKDLLEKCKFYHNGTFNNNYNCLITNHQNTVFNFIFKIKREYFGLIDIYMNVKKGYKLNDNINCNDLVYYIKFLEDLKEAKKMADNFEILVKNLKENKNS